jgi:hypothetical protein
MKIKTLMAFSVGIIFAVAFSAFAQPVAPTIPTTDAGAVDIVSQLWNLIVSKNYAAAFGPALTLIVWALKKWDTKIPKIGPAIDVFLNRPFVSFLLPTAISAIAGIGSALYMHQPLSAALGSVLSMSSSAIMTYIGLKKLTEATTAGDAAAAKVTDLKSAIEEIKKP